MKRLKSLLCMLIVLTIALSLCACGSKNEGTGNGTDGTSGTNGTAASGGTTSGTKCATLAAEGSQYKYDSITVGTNLFGRFLAGLSPSESDAACSLVFDVIFKVDPDTKEVYSNILDDWYFEDDTTLILKLKDNIYFSNGDHATAEDLLFSYYNHIERGSNYLNNYNINFDESKVVDDYTVSMKFDKFYAGFFTAFTIYFLDKSWSEEVGWDSLDWYAPVGSGAYTCTEFAQDDHITLEARDDYWNAAEDPVVVKKWILQYYSDTSTMYMDLEAGNIAMCAVEPTDYERYLNEGCDGITLENFSSGVVYSMNFGFMDNDIWYDKNLREAFACGINWAELGQIALGVTYKAADTLVTSDSPEYVDVGAYEYDPERAKELLAEAGYTADNPLKLETYMMDTPFYKSVCEAFQFYASQIGVDVSIEFGDISAALTEWCTPGGCDVGFYYDNLGSVEAQLLRSLDCAIDPNGVTWTYVDDQKFIDLYTEMAYSTDPNVTIEKSKELQQYVHDEFLAIPISEASFTIGYADNVFNHDQIKAGAMNSEYWNLMNMSVASAWQD